MDCRLRRATHGITLEGGVYELGALAEFFDQIGDVGIALCECAGAQPTCSP